MASVYRILLSAGCLVLALGLTVAARQQTPFRSGARTVAVYATVTDATGRLVPDLTRDDFEIYDNGKPQPSHVFANDIQPITIVMMLDRSGSMRANFRLVEAAAEAFVETLLPADKARIGSFAARIQVDPRDFTSDQEEMLNILRTELQPDGPTPLWNAVNVGDDGAAAPGGPPRSARVHRRRGSADELQHQQRQPEGRDEAAHRKRT